MGGIAGLACSMSGATEYQKRSTPHFHALIHLVNAYQYNTIADIANAIEQRWLRPASVANFSQWLHMEEPPSIGHHKREQSVVEEAWRRRFDDGAHEAARAGLEQLLALRRPKLLLPGGPRRAQRLPEQTPRCREKTLFLDGRRLRRRRTQFCDGR